MIGPQSQMLDNNLQEKVMPWTSRKGMGQKVDGNMMAQVYYGKEEEEEEEEENVMTLITAWHHLGRLVGGAHIGAAARCKFQTDTDQQSLVEVSLNTRSCWKLKQDGGLP